MYLSHKNDFPLRAIPFLSVSKYPIKIHNTESFEKLSTYNILIYHPMLMNVTTNGTKRIVKANLATLFISLQEMQKSDPLFFSSPLQSLQLKHDTAWGGGACSALK